MGYSDDASSVRVDFFKPSGKWYATEAVKWTGSYEEDIRDAFLQSLKDHFKGVPRYQGMTAVCLHPYHKHEHPLMVPVPLIIN